MDDQPDRALGAFVFELADGKGLIRHPDMGGSDEDGPITDEEPNTDEESSNTPTPDSSGTYSHGMVVTIIFTLLLTNYAMIL